MKPARTEKPADLRPHRPDLVLALVVPLGTPTRRLIESLESGLRSYGYDPRVIRMSNILQEYAEQIGASIPITPEPDRIRALQDLGDQYCAKTGDAAAIALSAILRIGASRPSNGHTPRRPRAWIVDSLKRGREVAQLRQVYGDHVIVVGAQASRQTRKRTLSVKIAPQTPSQPDDKIEAIIEQLFTVDLDSKHGDFGQNILDTLPMSDCFVTCEDDDRQTTGIEVTRMLDLLFSNPEAEIPTTDEYGMHLATSAAARSPELGRKVGAAILVGDSVVALGANSHPVAPTKSPHADRSKMDLSRLILDTMKRLAVADILSPIAEQELQNNADHYIQDIISKHLKGSHLTGLTEFQVPVHAEMSALLDALNQGKTVHGGIIYVTTYPCHGCARHILRAGLQVVYLGSCPPRSRAVAMYGRYGVDQFRPFTGISPDRYLRWFSAGDRRSAADGSKILWGQSERLAAVPRVTKLERETIMAREDAVSMRASHMETASDQEPPEATACLVPPQVT
ncbi:MAG: deaminase [Micropruina sp.]|uniref:deaminase n=1 Tax=Micropruina sp. TaxID=2737536 RepID=UPI0039E61B8E